MFLLSEPKWPDQAKLTLSRPQGGDEFGYSVAISGSGSTAVVGAPQRGGPGAAYVFVRSGTAWSQQAKLTASDARGPVSFGRSVAISGSTVVVGAPNKSGGDGAAYVFVRSGTAWSQQAKLTRAATDTQFGTSVAISGSTVVASAPSGGGAGTAFVFVRSGTAWSRQATLTSSDSGDEFGRSVVISASGSTVVVGAPVAGGEAGAAYVFVRSGTAWSQQAKLTSSDAAPSAWFGYSVAISGSTALLGAFSANDDDGAAYQAVRSGTVWSVAPLNHNQSVGPDEEFGWSVAISGSTALVGAPLAPEREAPGVAYVFQGP